ncbi:MAG: hypothetical protein WCG10_07515, partial [Chlamydiota bacterium]
MGLALTLDGESKKLLIRSVMEASIKYYGEYHSAVSLLCNTRLDAETNHNIVASILLDRIDQSKGTFSEQWSQAIKSCFPCSATIENHLNNTTLNKALVQILINRKEFQKAFDIGIIEIKEEFDNCNNPRQYVRVFPQPLNSTIKTLLIGKIDDALSKQDLSFATALSMELPRISYEDHIRHLVHNIALPIIPVEDTSLYVDQAHKILEEGKKIGRAEGNYIKIIELLPYLKDSDLVDDYKLAIILDRVDQLQEGSFIEKWEQSCEFYFPDSPDLIDHKNLQTILWKNLRFETILDLPNLDPNLKVVALALQKIIPETIRPYLIGINFLENIMQDTIAWEDLRIPDAYKDNIISIKNLFQIIKDIGKTEISPHIENDLLELFITSGLDAAKNFAKEQDFTANQQLYIDRLFRLWELA